MNDLIWKRSLCILLSVAMIFATACDKKEVKEETGGVGETETTENAEIDDKASKQSENADTISGYETDALMLDKLVGNATSCAVSQYTYASLLLEEVITADYASMPEEEAVALLDEALLAYERSDVAAQHMEQVVEANLKAQRGADILAALSVFEPVTVYAASNDQSAKEWAESITKTFDEGKAGQQVKHLAKQLGTDAKHAYKQLKMAQDILKGEYAQEEGEASEAIAVLEATKTACKVGVFLTAVAMTAGAAGAGTGVAGAGAAGTGTAAAGTGAAGATGATGAEIAGLVVNGVDVILEVSAEGSKIIHGADHSITQSLMNVKDAYSNVTFVFGLTQLSADKVADSLLFLGDAGARLYEEGKIGSIQVIGNSEQPEKPKLEYSQEDISGMKEEELASVYQSMSITTQETTEETTEETTLTDTIETMKSEADEAFLEEVDQMQPTGYEESEISLAELGEWLKEQEEIGNDVQWINEIIDETIFGDEDWMNADIDGLYTGTMTQSSIAVGKETIAAKTQPAGFYLERASEDSIIIRDGNNSTTVCTAVYNPDDNAWNASDSKDGVSITYKLTLNLAQKPYGAKLHMVIGGGAASFDVNLTKEDE